LRADADTTGAARHGLADRYDIEIDDYDHYIGSAAS
jgi:hypothetical protein